MFAILLMQIGFVQPVAAGTNAEKEAKFAEKVKDNITKLGTGTEAKVRLKLKDKTKLKGYISEAGTDTFTVIEAKNGAATVVAYSQVKQAKGRNNLTGKQIAIIAVAAALFIIPLVIFANSKGN